MASRPARRADDKRLKENRKPSTKAPVVHKTRYQMLIDKELTVEDLTDEEIRRGKCMDRNGGFSGRPPSEFPRELYDAMRIEFQKRVTQKFQENTELAIGALQEIVQNRRAAGPARVRAAEVLLERSLGKVPDKIFQQVEVKKFEQIFAGLLVDIEITDKDKETTDGA